MVPAVVLSTRLMPVLPDVVTEVFAKFKLAVDVSTLIPIPVGLDTVVEPVVKLPATPDRLIPVVALLAEEMLAIVALRVPVVRFRARPLPFRVTSETFNVPKPVPLMSPVELPPVNPRSVLFEPTVIASAALVILTIGAPGLVPGKGSLPVAGVIPEIEERLAVASCPMNF